MITILPPDSWLGQEWQNTFEGDELWLSARTFSIAEAYEVLKKQFGTRNMPLDFIQLGWIKYGWEQDDVDHDGDEMYWRGKYKRGSYPIWFIDDDIEPYSSKI